MWGDFWWALCGFHVGFGWVVFGLSVGWSASGQMSKAMIRLCLDKLRTFVEDPDQNCLVNCFFSSLSILKRVERLQCFGICFVLVQ